MGMLGEELTLSLAFLVSFFLGAALLVWLGVGGAAEACWGDAVVLLFALAAAAAGAEGGGIDRCWGVA